MRAHFEVQGLRSTKAAAAAHRARGIAGAAVQQVRTRGLSPASLSFF